MNIAPDQINLVNIISGIIYKTKYIQIDIKEEVENLELSESDRKAVEIALETILKTVEKYGQGTIPKIQE